MTTFCHAKNAPLVPKVQNTGCGPILGCEWFPDTGHDKKKGAFLAPGHRIHRGKPSLERHAGVWQSIGRGRISRLYDRLQLVRVDIRDRV